MDAILEWLLASDEPWTRYRTRLDLLGEPASNPAVSSARQEMIVHPKVRDLVASAAAWGEDPLKRHNDSRHPIHALSTLADFGMRLDDPGLEISIEKVLANQSTEGAFQTLVSIPQAFGGSGGQDWSWMACDAPILHYILLSFGLQEDARVEKAVDHLVGLVEENGWRCVCAPGLGKFRGPGRKTDPCPVANVYALKALSLVPGLHDSPAAHAGVEMLLAHWANPDHPKPYLFGVGTDYRKLKYPFVWYDILHVADVLSRFAFVHHDPRFVQMVQAITAQADPTGRYTAASMYQSWKGWSFADKKNLSPWLTFLVYAILKRIG
jgi:hypothetical protein